MRLGELTARLKAMPQDAMVRWGETTIGGLRQASGDHSHLVLLDLPDYGEPQTVASVLDSAQTLQDTAVDGFAFTEDTPVWVGEHPECAVLGLDLRDGVVAIDGADISDYTYG